MGKASLNPLRSTPFHAPLTLYPQDCDRYTKRTQSWRRKRRSFVGESPSRLIKGTKDPLSQTKHPPVPVLRDLLHFGLLKVTPPKLGFFELPGTSVKSDQCRQSLPDKTLTTPALELTTARLLSVGTRCCQSIRIMQASKKDCRSHSVAIQKH